MHVFNFSLVSALCLVASPAPHEGDNEISQELRSGGTLDCLIHHAILQGVNIAEVVGTIDWALCRNYCERRAKCKFFAWSTEWAHDHLERNRCHMMSTGVILKKARGAISGPKQCATSPSNSPEKPCMFPFTFKNEKKESCVGDRNVQKLICGTTTSPKSKKDYVNCAPIPGDSIYRKVTNYRCTTTFGEPTTLRKIRSDEKLTFTEKTIIPKLKKTCSTTDRCIGIQRSPCNDKLCYDQCSKASETRSEIAREVNDTIHTDEGFYKLFMRIRYGEWNSWLEWSPYVDSTTLRTRKRTCKTDPCEFDGVTTSDNREYIYSCNDDEHDKQMKQFDDDFFADFLTRMNRHSPLLKWAEVVQTLSDNRNKFVKEMEPLCVSKDGQYDIHFFCNLGNTLHHKACEYYMLYDELVLTVSEPSSKNGRKSRHYKIGPVVQTTTNHATALKNQMDENFFRKQTMDMDSIKKKISTVDNKFREDFGAYLSGVASFDYELANQDKIYLDGMIETWRIEINKWSEKLANILKYVISLAIPKTTADSIQAGAALAEEVASNCNPLAWITGSADVGDILEAATDVAANIKDNLEMRKLKTSLKKIATIVKRIKDGIKTNSGLHKDFLKLTTIDIDSVGIAEIKKLAMDYTNAYGSFSPGIDETDIANLIALLESITDGVCDEINEDESAVGVGMSMALVVQGYCTGTTIGPLIAQLDSTLGESYGAQFELMDAGAAMAKALIAGSLSKTITESGVPAPERPRDYIKGMILVFVNRRDVVVAACDALEYEIYGEKISECEILREDPMSPKITQLSQKTNSQHRPSCHTSDQYIYIPASLTTSKDEGHVNLRDLYEKGTARLNISSVDYARKYSWIMKSDPGDKVFIKKFQLLLPPDDQDKTRRHDEITLEHGGANRVNGRTFFLAASKLVTSYTYNPKDQCSPMETDPYLTPKCPSPFLKSVRSCITKSGVSEDKYLPSLYGDWTITLHNNLNNSRYLKRIRMPNVTGILYLQARVRTCSDTTSNGRAEMRESEERQEEEEHNSEEEPKEDQERRRRRKGKCCATQGKVWNIMSDKHGACKKCPEKSGPAVQGYFCAASSKVSLATGLFYKRVSQKHYVVLLPGGAECEIYKKERGAWRKVQMKPERAEEDISDILNSKKPSKLLLYGGYSWVWFAHVTKTQAVVVHEGAKCALYMKYRRGNWKELPMKMLVSTERDVNAALNKAEKGYYIN